MFQTLNWFVIKQKQKNPNPKRSEKQKKNISQEKKQLVRVFRIWCGVRGIEHSWAEAISYSYFDLVFSSSTKLKSQFFFT